jgi:hypothetical protein
MLNDLIIERDPPENRQGTCLGPKERHLPEAAVMLAYAMHLFQTVPGVSTVDLHPDGQHGKQFEIKKWLSANGFNLTEPRGRTNYCGTYVRERQTVVVTSTPGKCDVVAETEAGKIVAECKGGIVNTKHAGQKSRLRKGLCEAVGLLMVLPKGGRQVAVVPKTAVTADLGKKIAPRANEAGIEIALVGEQGQVGYVKP